MTYNQPGDGECGVILLPIPFLKSKMRFGKAGIGIT